MAVIIKGFNKPKNCYTCPFNNSDCYCNLTEGTIDRDDWDCSIACPIEELLEGHGRLIDADKLAKEVKGYICDTSKLHYDALLQAEACNCAYYNCLDEIKDAPPILEAHKTESEDRK